MTELPQDALGPIEEEARALRCASLIKSAWHPWAHLLAHPIQPGRSGVYLKMYRVAARCGPGWKWWAGIKFAAKPDYIGQLGCYCEGDTPHAAMDAFVRTFDVEGWAEKNAHFGFDAAEVIRNYQLVFALANAPEKEEPAR